LASFPASPGVETFAVVVAPDESSMIRGTGEARSGRWRMRTLGLSTLGLVASFVVAGAAHADTVSGTRCPDLHERVHDIALRFERTHATLVVQRTFENPGKEYDQAEVRIVDLPVGAIAIGLRTQALKNGQPIWYAGDLLEAELAAHRYHELTGIGGYYPKDPALLSWRGPSELALQVFPIDPKGTKTIEYTLAVPVRYEDGRYHLRLPRMGSDALPATVTLSPANASDVLSIGEGPITKGARRQLDDELAIDLAPANAPMFEGTMASVWFGTEKKPRALLHTSLALAPRLSEPPQGAYVVVVLDASRSLSAAQREAEVAAASSYLRQMPDAHVEVLAFDRTPHARHGKFVAGALALADLAAKPLSAGNGSALDLALVEAKSRLAAAPAGAPRRVIALTDLRTRDALKPASLKGLESANAIVHLGVISVGHPALDRDDDGPWAAVVRPTGGLLWRAEASSNAKYGAEMKEVYEEWVRPRKIDHLVVTGIGVSDQLGLPSTMSEGSGFEDLRLASYATPALEIHGELWATKVKTLIASTKEQEKLWSALVFGDDELRAELTEPEMMVLAMKGGAVSPVTSYLAIEPGVRPSMIGLDWGEGIGVGGFGSMGYGSGGGGAGMGIGLGKAFSPIVWLRGELAKVAVLCGATGRTVQAVVETTSTEIVDVFGVTLGAPTSSTDAKLRSCVTEALWSLELPSFFTLDHTTYAVNAAG
jgi:hypothetical protein